MWTHLGEGDFPISVIECVLSKKHKYIWFRVGIGTFLRYKAFSEVNRMGHEQAHPWGQPRQSYYKE